MAYQSIPGPGSASGSSSSSGFHYFNSPFGDTTFTKVFVGGLAWETQSETIRLYFEQFGEILEAVVITERITGRSKGYGFVTFRDPEAARRACINPSPVIDGRRTNCNLAALGRLRPPPHYGHLRAISSHIASMQSPRGAYVGSPTYHQPVSYSQQGFTYPPYGYTAYGPEYIYPQGAYNPYIAQQYLQMYGVPSPVNSAMYPFGQMRQPLSGNQGYTAVHGYTMPAHHVFQFSGLSNGLSAAHIPSMQGPYSAGLSAAHIPSMQGPYSAVVAAPFPAQQQFIVLADSPEFMQGSGSDQKAD